MVFSGTKFQPGAISMFGDAVGLGVLKLRSLIFWNNGLDASPTESSEAVAALVQIMQSENVNRRAQSHVPSHLSYPPMLLRRHALTLTQTLSVVSLSITPISG